MPDAPAKKGSNTFTYAQRKKLEKRECGDTEPINLKPECLDPTYAEGLRKQTEAAAEAAGVTEARARLAAQKWMTQLASGNCEGPELDASRYLIMRDQPIIGNPRQTEEYRKMCREAVGVGDTPDRERYAHLKDEDFPALRWVVSRGSGCMWLPDTPRTTVKGFKHRLITKGPPVRGKLFRLNRPDTEWVENAIQEDVKRGQLERGTSDWGFPAFPTKETPSYKAIKRGRRLVVDYRELNKVTVRKLSLIHISEPTRPY